MFSQFQLHTYQNYLEEPFGPVTIPRLMPTVTNSCDEEEWPQNSSQNLHKYPWCTTLSYSHGYFCSFFIELNTLTSGTITYGAQMFESVTVRLQIIINISTIYMLLDVIWSCVSYRYWRIWICCFWSLSDTDSGNKAFDNFWAWYISTSVGGI